MRTREGDLSREESRVMERLLKGSSRTFALSIPLLPQPTRFGVTVAYLLFRIADTFEDASLYWERSRRVQSLSEFGELMRSNSVDKARSLAERWLEDPPSEHRGYLDLLSRTPLVMRAYLSLGKDSREVVARHTLRTVEGMIGFVERTGEDGQLRLADLSDLRSYCYVVAGIVGELLTELFLLRPEDIRAAGSYLADRAASFGEGLQLVNVLRDSASDVSEGRSYVPPDIARERLFELARRDLQAATEYVLRLQEEGAAEGVVAFCGLPVALAWATLDRVELSGPGAKLSRPEVFRLHRDLMAAIRDGRPVLEAGPTSAFQGGAVDA